MRLTGKKNEHPYFGKNLTFYTFSYIFKLNFVIVLKQVWRNCYSYSQHSTCQTNIKEIKTKVKKGEPKTELKDQDKYKNNA